jgi:hypothetical protein
MIALDMSLTPVVRTGSIIVKITGLDWVGCAGVASSLGVERESTPLGKLWVALWQ